MAPSLLIFTVSASVWGDSTAATTEPVSGFGEAAGFGEADGFDSFLSMTAPPPEVTPRRRDSADSDEAPDFSVYIKYEIQFLL